MVLPTSSAVTVEVVLGVSTRFEADEGAVTVTVETVDGAASAESAARAAAGERAAVKATAQAVDASMRDFIVRSWRRPFRSSAG
jgi:hypothetical protein